MPALQPKKSAKPDKKRPAAIVAAGRMSSVNDIPLSDRTECLVSPVKFIK